MVLYRHGNGSLYCLEILAHFEDSFETVAVSLFNLIPVVVDTLLRVDHIAIPLIVHQLNKVQLNEAFIIHNHFNACASSNEYITAIT